VWLACRCHKRKREWNSDWSFPEGQSLQTCILSVFLVYAREAIELGKKGVWTVDQVRAQALEGLGLITLEIGFKRDYHTFIERNGGSITPETQREFEATTEWEQFEDELLGLAESARHRTVARAGFARDATRDWTSYILAPPAGLESPATNSGRGATAMPL
jgi:hypothetical protein